MAYSDLSLAGLWPWLAQAPGIADPGPALVGPWSSLAWPDLVLARHGPGLSNRSWLALPCSGWPGLGLADSGSAPVGSWPCLWMGTVSRCLHTTAYGEDPSRRRSQLCPP